MPNFHILNINKDYGALLAITPQLKEYKNRDPTKKSWTGNYWNVVGAKGSLMIRSGKGNPLDITYASDDNKSMLAVVDGDTKLYTALDTQQTKLKAARPDLDIKDILKEPRAEGDYKCINFHTEYTTFYDEQGQPMDRSRAVVKGNRLIKWDITLSNITYMPTAGHTPYLRLESAIVSTTPVVQTSAYSADSILNDSDDEGSDEPTMKKQRIIS
jgi:hypothetical protein